MKLVEITFREAPRLPGVRAGDMIPLKCFEPSEAMKGWRALIRGASIFFISPPGFLHGRNRSEFDPKGPSMIHEVPRMQCYLHWSGSPDEIMNVAKHDTPPFGPEPIDVVPEEPAAGGLLAQVGV